MKKKRTFLYFEKKKKKKAEIEYIKKRILIAFIETKKQFQHSLIKFN